MKNFVKNKIIKAGHYFSRLEAKKTLKYVKNFYRENKSKNIKFQKNIWNNIIYWDFYYQRLPHSIQSKYFVPYDYYIYKIEPVLNDSKMSYLTGMKNLYDKLFSDSLVRQPATLLRCMNYIYMDKDYNTVTKPADVINNLKQTIIIKPGTASHGGAGILKYCYNEGQYIKIRHNIDLNIDEICKIMKGDFIIQEVHRQHPELAKFHEYSVNSIRVFTYRSVKTNEIVFPMTTIRFGINESYVDNAAAGGIFMGINNDGSLMKFAVDINGNHYYSHPNTNIKFEGSFIPSYEKIEAAAAKLSNIVPYLRLIGWDFSVDTSGEPVLIELNVGQGIWAYQIATGRPLFGEYSREIKEYIDNFI